MQMRLSLALVEWRAPAAAPAPTQLTTQTTDAYAVAQAMVTAMQRSEEAERRRREDLREELADVFLKGADITARRFAEVSGDPTYKRFSRTQKGKIMGWCGAKTWDNVPKFWHNVEATKSEDNLRTMLDRMWKLKMGDMDKNIYKIY
jgi:hypothetical protein